MNTRKSSPLPNPNDTIARYQISYRIHYQNLHRHLLTRIYKEEAQKNRLVKQFTRLIKHYEKLKEKFSKCKGSKSEEENQVNSKMSILYSSICQKELQINKLYEQSEGILLQLCDMLKSSEEDMRKIRESNDTNHTQIRFLHHESLYQHGEETSFGKSFDRDITMSSGFGEENDSKEIRFDESNEKTTTRIGKLDMSGSFEKILKERINRSKQMQENKESRDFMTIEKVSINASQQSENGPIQIQEQQKQRKVIKNNPGNAKQELNTMEQKKTSEGQNKKEMNPNLNNQNNQTKKSVICKLLNNYEKQQINTQNQKKIPKLTNKKEVIEINSSAEDCPRQKVITSSVNPPLEMKISKNLSNCQQKTFKKSKQNLKSCITILD